MLENGGLRCLQVEDQVRRGSDGERGCQTQATCCHVLLGTGQEPQPERQTASTKGAGYRLRDVRRAFESWSPAKSPGSPFEGI